MSYERIVWATSVGMLAAKAYKGEFWLGLAVIAGICLTASLAKIFD